MCLQSIKSFKEIQHVLNLSVPEFVAASKPIVDGNITARVYIINWANSFVLNGELIEYQLVENGDKVYSGIATVVERRLDTASKFCQNDWERGEKGGTVEEGYAQLSE